MVKCIGINDQAKSELLVSYAIIINEGIPDEYRAAVAFARKILFMFKESSENEELLGNIDDLIKANIDK